MTYINACFFSLGIPNLFLAVTGKVSVPWRTLGLVAGLILLWIHSYGAGALIHMGFGAVLAAQAVLLIIYSYMYVRYACEALRDEVSWGNAGGLAPVGVS